MEQAKNGDRVKIHFKGKTPEGEVFASSEGDEPLEFQIGEGQLLPGVEKAIEGMEVGEEKIVTLPPQDGFGERRSELVIMIPKSDFPADIEPEVGMELQAQQPDGSVAFLKILEIGDDAIKLDANHPLAGETLTFELQLVTIT